MVYGATTDEQTLPIVDVFRVLSDPTRWEIVREMAAVDELACRTLAETLPISKATISYHIKLLYYADLVSIRKDGRRFFYTLRRDKLRELVAILDDQLGLDDLPACKIS